MATLAQTFPCQTGRILLTAMHSSTPGGVVKSETFPKTSFPSEEVARSSVLKVEQKISVTDYLKLAVKPTVTETKWFW